MSKKQISSELMKLVKKAQIDEEQGTILYAFMAKREKNEENKKLLEQMSKDLEDYTERVELPPCSEEIVYENGKLYVLFESAGKKYLEGTDGKGKSVAPINKILVIYR